MAAPIDGERDLERSDSVTNPSTQFSTEERTGGLEIQRLIADDDVDLLCPINYVYDFLPSSMLWLNPQPVSLPTSVASALEERWPESLHGNPRSIRLSPREAGLPIRTGLTQFRQSRHWKVGVQAAERLLRLFAQDQHCAEVTLEKGESIAGQASKQLAVSAVDTLGRYIVYMGAEADHTRVQLLMQSMVLIFVFDDMWELISSREKINQLRDRFVAPLAGKPPVSGTDSPLETAMRDLREDFLRCDAERGNGGHDVLQYLIEFYEHPPPPQFTSVRDYLDYRFEDVGCVFVCACAKFSIASNINLADPKLRTLLHYLGDHLSIANDLASYDKEKRSYEIEGADALINVVHVIAKTGGEEDEHAKLMAYAWQLWTESRLADEMNRLHEQGLMDLEEWAWVDACLLAASGNVLTSVVSARYGGRKIVATG